MSQKNSRPKTSFVEFWFELLGFGPPVQCFPLEKFSECIQFLYSIAFPCQLLSDTRHLSNAVIKYTSYYNLSFFSFHVFIRREITNPQLFCSLSFSISEDIAMCLFTLNCFSYANFMDNYVFFQPQLFAPQIVETDFSTSTSCTT